MDKFLFSCLLILQSFSVSSQINWQIVDAEYQPLSNNVHVFKTIDSLENKPFLAYYVTLPIKDKNLVFSTDSTYKRRLKPIEFYTKNNHPLIVVNGTFFSFGTNQNVSVLINNKKKLGYNVHTIANKGKDTLTYKHPIGSAIGISKNRNVDVAWIFTDSSKKYFYASQANLFYTTDSFATLNFKKAKALANSNFKNNFKKWKMKTAIGGGPVLLQNGKILITNNAEYKFAGKALADKHPRTCMGYTKDGSLIILVVQGRQANAAGATLTQCAEILQKIGCVEALNLDGGGSSCLLINGKETIKPSDKEGQRPVPGVFIVQTK
jgi:uncharacterized protein YigE (DUF2233 family)